MLERKSLKAKSLPKGRSDGMVDHGRKGFIVMFLPLSNLKLVQSFWN